MSRFYPLFLILCFIHRCLAYDSLDQEHLVIRLDTQSPVVPLSLAPLQTEGLIDAKYATELQRIFEFDLNHNGATYLVAWKPTFEAPIGPTVWKELRHLIRWKVSDRNLEVQVYSAGDQGVFSIKEIPITGDLSHDRRVLHQIADTIADKIFGVQGIASTKIICTVKVQKNKGDARSDVWECDYDGGNARQVTSNSGYIVTPIYVPPKQGHVSGALFFVSYQTGQPKIYYQTLSGGKSKRFSELKGNQLMPAISKQRDKVAFISDVSGNPDLFIQAFSPEEGAIGKPYQIFSCARATQGSPTFSPDGKNIAFVSNKDGTPRIYIMPVPSPGTSLRSLQPTLLTKLTRESTAPAWSPDGRKIAYCAMTNGTRQIWVYDFDKKQEVQITEGPGNKENPSWAPNSLHLIFNSSDQKSCELYFTHLYQRKIIRISPCLGEKHFPNWEPREIFQKKEA